MTGRGNDGARHRLTANQGLAVARVLMVAHVPPVAVVLAMVLALALAAPGCDRPAPPADERTAVPVEIIVAAPDSLAETSVITGVLEAYRAVDVVCEVSGEVASVGADVGDRVAAGDVLASIDRRVARENLKQAEAALMAATARHGIAWMDFRRDSTLHASGDIAQAAYEASRMARTTAEAELLSAEATRELAARQLEETDIRAPFAGHLSRRHCELGTYVSPGMPVYRLVDVGSLRLRLGVSQRNVARLRPGAEARITVEALDGRSFLGRIRSVSPEADASTRTFMVEVVIANPPGKPLRDGLVVRAALVLERRDGVIAVPREAVLGAAGQEFVFVVEDSTAHERMIERGPLIGGYYVIEQGLAPGDVVVAVGMQNLREGTPVVIEAAGR